MSISLSKFKPKSIEARRTTGAGPPTIVFIGKRGTGKSTLVADILYYMRPKATTYIYPACHLTCHIYMLAVIHVYICICICICICI